MERKLVASGSAEIDPRRIEGDADYRERLARLLLESSATDADHVELRRTAVRVFPALARETKPLARLVGSAATLRVEERETGTPDILEVSLIQKPTNPLDYTPDYADLDAGTRTLLIRFCEQELEAGREGRDALQNLDRYHGWPYSDRTFYVGPWKAARLRRRRRDDD